MGRVAIGVYILSSSAFVLVGDPLLAWIIHDGPVIRPPGVLGALHLAPKSPPFANSATAQTYDALGRVSGRSVGGDADTMGYDKIGRPSAHVNDLGAFQLSYLGETGQLVSRLSGLFGTDWAYQGNHNDRRLRSIVNTLGASRYQYATTAENDILASMRMAAIRHGCMAMTGRTGSLSDFRNSYKLR